MTKGKKVFAVIMLVMVHIMLNALVVLMGGFICGILYELVDAWTINNFECFGMWMLVPQGLWFLMKVKNEIESRLMKK